MTDRISPGTPEWEALKDEIAATESSAATHTNHARDALIKQGRMLLQVAPELVPLMAEQTGVSIANAKTRRRVAAAVSYGSPIKILLDENPEVSVSFDALNAMLADENPQALLANLILTAKANGATRITRDAARRARGIVPGSVGTAESTAEQLVTSSTFAAATLEALAQQAKTLAPAERDRLVSSFVSAGLGITEQDRADHGKAIERGHKEREARLEAPSGVRALNVLPLMFEADSMVETLEVAARDDESLRVMALFADWAERMAVRARAVANGDHVPPSEDDFAAGIEAILDGAS